MLLNNKGSASYGFIGAFLVIFFICFVYAYLSIYGAKTNDYQDNNTDYEKVLKEATEKYINKYYSDLALDSRIIIKMSTLRSYNYLTLNECTGYSIVQNINGYNLIEPFVKCKDYVSDKYQAIYE